MPNYTLGADATRNTTFRLGNIKKNHLGVTYRVQKSCPFNSHLYKSKQTL